VLDRLVSRIRTAARLNAGSALVVQVLALATVASYYAWPAAHALLDRLMALKQAWGLGYSFAAGALFAGLLPRLAMRWSGSWRGPLAPELGFALLFWGYRSAEVDLLYRLQSHWFGDGAGWGTVLAKTAVDQLLYSPLWAVPQIALVHLAKDARWSWRGMGEHLDREFFTLRLPSAVVGNAMVWTPAVLAIYFLPAALQLPVSNLVASFWVLLMAVLLARKPPIVQETT
jgi:hypothetical protein